MKSPDKQMKKRLRKGEASAFAELYDLLGDKIYRYIYSQLGNAQDTSDVLQDVFVQLVKSHRSLAAAKNLNGYVFRTARNEVIRWRKKQKRHEHSDQQKRTLQTKPVDSAEISIDGSEWVSNILQGLDPVDREIVALKAISKLTFPEIADVTGIQQSNIASRYRRSMLKLKKQLSSDQPDTENSNRITNQ